MGAEQALNRWQPLSADFYVLRTLTPETERLHQDRTALNHTVAATSATLCNMLVLRVRVPSEE